MLFQYLCSGLRTEKRQELKKIRIERRQESKKMRVEKRSKGHCPGLMGPHVGLLLCDSAINIVYLGGEGGIYFVLHASHVLAKALFERNRKHETITVRL